MAEDRSGDGVGLKKNITLSADEPLIEAARARAHAEQTESWPDAA